MTSLIFGLQPCSVWSKPAQENRHTYQLIDRYQKELAQMDKALCPAPSRQKFEKLFDNFKANGFSVPQIKPGVIDIVAIKTMLPSLKEKRKWLQKQKDHLPSNENLKSYLKNIALQKQQLNAVLSTLEKINTGKLPKGAPKGFELAVNTLASSFNLFLNEIPFLLSFGFPVDHLANRLAFERATEKSQRNEILLKRKLHEDGAMDPDLKNPDLYLRTTIDTLALKLREKSIKWSDDIRYDLEWVLNGIGYQLEGGREQLWSRLSEWQGRMDRAIEFYTRLLNAQKVPKQVIAETAKLRQMVQKKILETYIFWSQRSSLLQSVFVLDQILLNEVGQATGENVRDRQDVIQVVSNRRMSAKYTHSSLDKVQLTKLARKSKIAKFKIKANPWLNILFQDGEFSFTYYFFYASQYLFCPDFSIVAKKTRSKNLPLIIDRLENPEPSFQALRYFSRNSMIGRIDIAGLWSDYERIPERPGRLLKEGEDLAENVKKGDYRYLYRYTDPEQQLYDVLQIREEEFAVQGFPTQPVFYNHRDPNKFSYFAPKQETVTATDKTVKN